ncbi:MAG: efflux RND transporter periplasmic adaptor subunit [Gammaproteobacteria bacterium]|nr:efflux RND transporter periplasmic adaptor subunit [Gammaproteobacteria bacterium]
MFALLRKHPVITITSLVIIGLLIAGFWPQPVLVEAELARQAPMTVTIEEEGRTRIIDRYVISAPVDGVACRVQLDIGDPVKQGEMLLSVSPLKSPVLDQRSQAQAQARVAAAESSLRAAKEQATAATAAAQLAVTEQARLQPLLDKKLVARDVYDKAVTAVQTTAASKRSADFNVEVARYELEAARTMLHYADTKGQTERIPVYSPINGRILKVAHECEGPVRTGDPLLEVGDPDALEVVVDVLSADAVKIKPGMQVLFDRWGGEGTLEGVVRTVEPVGFTKISALGVEEQRVLVVSDFTSPHEKWQRLGDGYRVEARFVLWHEDSVLQVPASSLFRYNDGWALFVIDDGRARRREVKVGQRNGLTAQIEAGIKQGEQVINHPSDEVEDGKRVKLRTAG